MQSHLTIKNDPKPNKHNVLSSQMKGILKSHFHFHFHYQTGSKLLGTVGKKKLNAIKEPEKKNRKQIHKVFNYK